jgi:hypothetical protein
MATLDPDTGYIAITTEESAEGPSTPDQPLKPATSKIS